jgi:ribose transport system ATP-binding protein
LEERVQRSDAASGTGPDRADPDGFSSSALQDHQRARVSIHGLSKTFPGTLALDEVDLEIGAGEVHSLCGGNGSGKSTLVKILSGVYPGDPGGTLRVDDHEIAVDATSPEFARSMGIHVVHQDLGVFLDMSVTENIALGHRYPARGGVQVRWPELRRRAAELLERFEIDASPGTLLREMSQSARTQVAIARALQDDDARGVLVLDEPTSSLPAHEVELLLRTLRRCAARGQSILYVSHRLDEVLAISDQITVLRDGRRVATVAAAGLGEEDLIGEIVGHQIDRVFPPMPEVDDSKDYLLRVRGMNAGPLRDISFEVAQGEVVGIAGLLGSGRTELLETVFGVLPLESGEVQLGGEPLNVRRPADAMAAGIAFVPENRAEDAAMVDMSVTTNISAATFRNYWSWRRPWVATRRMRRDAEQSMGEFMVKAASEESLLSSLSGGNQQKVILARWLRRDPRLLLLDEPTQGVDVGARAEIYALVRKSVADGASAIIVASDFEELAHVCDRVLVLSRGRITGQVKPPHLHADYLMQAANQATNGRSSLGN